MAAGGENDFERCYRTLEVPPSASPEDVRSAYRLLVKVWHPDRFAQDAALQARAAEKLKVVTAAYLRLKEASFPRILAAASVSSRPTRKPPVPASSALLALTVAADDRAHAAVAWEKPLPHPTLFGERPRLALAALLYGRALAMDPASRAEAILCVEDGIERLGEGPALLAPDRPTALSSPGRFHVWPRRLVSSGALRPTAAGRVLLEGVTVPRLRVLRWDPRPEVNTGLSLIALCALAGELRSDDCRLLGRVLAGMNGFFASPSEAFEAGSESVALASLTSLSGPPAGPGR